MGNKSKGSAARPKKRRGFAGKKREKVVEAADVLVRNDMETTTTGDDSHDDGSNVPSTSTNTDIVNVSVAEPSLVEPAVKVSTSKRKLDLFRKSMGTQDVNYDDVNSSPIIMEPYKIFSNAFVLSLLKFVSCSKCNVVGDCILKEGNREGLSCFYELFCNTCKSSFFSSVSSPMANKDTRLRDINTRFIYACKNSGVNYEQACTFLSDLNLPHPIARSNFQTGINRLAKACETAMEEHKCLIKNLVRRSNANGDSVLDDDFVLDDESVVDIKVSFDGSWQKRGHTSHNGVATAIDVCTGYCVDFELLSNFCITCVKGPKEGDDNYEEFMENHRPHCHKNTEAKSGAMEAEGALKIWDRTVGSNVNYSVILSDGDSSSYNKLREAQPYGKDKPVRKEECINHVAKRLGTRLRKLVANNTVDDGKGGKMPMGGAKGCLTEKYIMRLQNYYRKAITEHPYDVAGMRKAILATLYHSTGKSHDYCPVDGWCCVRDSRLSGDSDRVHKPDMPLPYFDLLVNIYEDLSTDELLSRCSSVSTQNANESLNAEIWRHNPKVNWCGERSLYAGICMAVIGFNAGAKEVCSIQRHLGIAIGKNSAAHAKKKDEERTESLRLKRSVKAHKSVATADVENRKAKVARLAADAAKTEVLRKQKRKRGECSSGDAYEPGGY